MLPESSDVVDDQRGGSIPVGRRDLRWAGEDEERPDLRQL